MARLPRLWIPGLPEHLVIRGNNRQAIFRSDGDRVYFHRCLVELAKSRGVEVHAYVFMGNHVHLLATGASAGNISRMVQALGRRYVSYFNYLHKRTGTLWEGRFRASAVESDRYLLTCQRYIELNPVRAGIVSDPLDFPWSSHRRLVKGTPDDLVTPHPLHLGLAEDEFDRRARYRELFNWAIPADVLTAIRQSLNKGWALASAEYCRQLERKSGRQAAPLKKGRRKRSSTSSELT